MIASLIIYGILVIICLFTLSNDESLSDFIKTNKVVSSAYLRFNPLSRLFQFVSGMLLAGFVQQSQWESIKKNPIFSINSVLILIGLWFLYYVRFDFYYIRTSSEILNHMYNLTFIEIVNTFAALLIILCCVVNRGYLCEILSVKLCKDLGKISYGVFIFHPVLSAVLFRSAWYNALNTDRKIIIYFVLLIYISSILYWIFEYKFRRIFLNITKE